MAELQRIGSLEIEDDARFRRRDQIFQRVGIAGIAVWVAVACAGLFGSGPWAKAGARSESFTVTYDRFCRRDAPSEIKVETRASNAGLAELILGGDAGATFRIEDIVPPPETVTVQPSGTRYLFRAAPGAVKIRILVSPVRWGSSVTEIGEPGGARLRLRQWIHF